MLLPVTLSTAAAVAIIAIWLSMRVGKVRRAEKISVGDGGNEFLIRRMRAHINFVESAPFVLILIAAIELAGRGGTWLSLLSGAFILGRIAHGIGMDGKGFAVGRAIGTIVTLLVLLVLAVIALLVSLRVL